MAIVPSTLQEINHYCVEGIVREPEQDACLADSGITDEQQFEQQIVALLGHFSPS